MQTSRNEIAPAEVEGSTGAVAEATRGDGFPLPASYDVVSAASKARTLSYVNVVTGQACTYCAPLTASVRHAIDTANGLRLLMWDSAAREDYNAELAQLAINAILMHGTATSVPVRLLTHATGSIDRFAKGLGYPNSLEVERELALLRQFRQERRAQAMPAGRRKV